MERLMKELGWEMDSAEMRPKEARRMNTIVARRIVSDEVSFQSKVSLRKSFVLDEIFGENTINSTQKFRSYGSAFSLIRSVQGISFELELDRER